MGLSTATIAAAGASGWQQRLRRALAEERFVLHFQPILSLSSGEISHHEALLRLADRPDGRLVGPARFLAHAERSGLIREIDRFVLDRVLALLDEACEAEACAGEIGAPPTIAVNLSARSLIDDRLIEHLEREFELRPHAQGRLILELTETAAITDMAAARRFCVRALGLGCGIALDDFGSGYGSFRYVKHLPFSHLKIDGEFIRRLPCSRTDQLVVQAIAGLARGLGGETVAEFVGDGETLELLRGYGVDYAQGFAVGAPRPLHALAC